MAAVTPTTVEYVAEGGPVPTPIAGQKNFLVTSALPYSNNVPHLGNIIGCVLSADVYARFLRQRHENVIYVCGTDEYGTATETRALQEGTTPQELCDRYHAIHRQCYEWFSIKFDFFGRTTTEQQTQIAQDIFTKAEANGYILEDTVSQLYCTQCDKFLADRFVEGTCPLCQYPDARGDQCDGCGKLLNPTELVDPRCKVCGASPEVRTSQHLFLDLPKINDELEAWIEATQETGAWSANSTGITRSWIKKGLLPRCITRDLKWGTPVPKPGYDDKVFYVWFDAPIGYLSITANAVEDWEAWWKAPDDVALYQFMGKDNVPFHTVMFPASLIASRDPYTLLHHISTTDYLNYEDAKFSKSRGVGVFGDNVQETGIPADVWRYYLLVNRPENSDTVFVWEDFQQKNNAELLANVGNFVNRAVSFCAKQCGGTVPALGELTEVETTALERINEHLATYNGLLDRVKIKDALREAMLLSSACNTYYQDAAPWVANKAGDTARRDTIVAFSLELVRLLSAVLGPYLPNTTTEIARQLGLYDEAVGGEQHPFVPDTFVTPSGAFTAGAQIGTPQVLFTRIEDDQVTEFRARFGGTRAERGDAGAVGGGPGSSGGLTANLSLDEVSVAVDQQKAVLTHLKATLEGGAPEVQAAVAVLKLLIKTQKELDPAAKDLGKKKGKKKGGKKGGGGGGGGKNKNKKKNEEPVDPNACDYDMRVGHIRSAAVHPNADSLWVLTVDVGEDEARQICAGLRAHYTEEELVGRAVVVLCNLKPSKLRGEISQGMLLAACVEGESDDHSDDVVGLLTPTGGADVAPGARCYGDGKAPSAGKRITKKVLEKHTFVTGPAGVVFDDDVVICEGDGQPVVADPDRNIPEGALCR